MIGRRVQAIAVAGAWVLSYGCVAYTKDAPARPRYEVLRTEESIAIDGEVLEREWRAASAPMELVFPWESQTGAKQATRVRLLWDDQYLYAAYECDDTEVAARFTDRDSWVYRDDTVELFLNVKPAQTAMYYCLEVNARGTLMDYVCVDAQYYLRRFNLDGVQIAVKIDGTLNTPGDIDRGWSLELAVPWFNFQDMVKEAPQPGTVYSANLNRWDGVEPNRRLSVWADSRLSWPHPHAPVHFGELFFAGKREHRRSESARFRRDWFVLSPDHPRMVAGR
jgi:hypothetical protein